MAALDFTSLDNAIAQLKIGLDTLNSAPENQLYRDGVIQRFEFTYGLSHRVLVRFLEQTPASPEEIEQMSFSALIRTGSERGLLRSGWPEWKTFREARKITRHTCNQAKAEEVLRVVPAFLAEAEYLYEQVNRLNQ